MTADIPKDAMRRSLDGGKEIPRVGGHRVTTDHGNPPSVDFGISGTAAPNAGLGRDLVAYIRRQREWSLRTFGPGNRAAGVVAHIRKELVEVESKPDDVFEWVDIIILAMDGAWRAGHSPETIAAAVQAKQDINERRKWPDWRTADPNGAIEHERDT